MRWNRRLDPVIFRSSALMPFACVFSHVQVGFESDARHGRAPGAQQAAGRVSAGLRRVEGPSLCDNAEWEIGRGQRPRPPV